MIRYIIWAVLSVVILVIIIFLILPRVSQFLTPKASSNPIPLSIQIPTSSPIPTLTATPSASPTLFPSTTEATKTYKGNGFSLQYPASWGLLTCRNSSDFEFDPTDSTNTYNVDCNYALRPISVQIFPKPNDCPGNTIQLGKTSVTKSQTQTDKYTEYKWCTMTHPSLIVTHRVSINEQRAVTTNNYSNSIEQVLSTFSY